MAALEKNNIYTARIEGYSSEGLGIARIDGQVVFVHGAVRGELCRVLVMKVLKNAAFGKVTELLEPSPERREPDCPYYGRCGGCDFRHLSYREELWAKRQRVQDALTRLGGSDVEVEEILGAAETTVTSTGGAGCWASASAGPTLSRSASTAPTLGRSWNRGMG